APTSVRPALLLDLATKESLRVQPREPTDVLEPLPDSNYWKHVAAQIRDKQGMDTQAVWSVNQIPAVWVSFEINDDKYWPVFERAPLALTAGAGWLSWRARALLRASIGAAVDVRCVVRPPALLARLAQQFSRG